MKEQKTVGILGGMGPFATLDFFAQVLKHTHVSRDSEHLRILIDNNVKLPSRTRAVLKVCLSSKVMSSWTLSWDRVTL